MHKKHIRTYTHRHTHTHTHLTLTSAACSDAARSQLTRLGHTILYPFALWSLQVLAVALMTLLLAKSSGMPIAPANAVVVVSSSTWLFGRGITINGGQRLFGDGVVGGWLPWDPVA